MCKAMEQVSRYPNSRRSVMTYFPQLLPLFLALNLRILDSGRGLHHLLSLQIRMRRLILPSFTKWKCICQNVFLQQFLGFRWPEVFYLTLVQCWSAFFGVFYFTVAWCHWKVLIPNLLLVLSTLGQVFLSFLSFLPRIPKQQKSPSLGIFQNWADFVQVFPSFF